MTLYTIGYEKRTIDGYVQLLREHEIDVVIDVRETAWSHKPGFSKGKFSAALADAGIDYVHAPWAGNPKWLREVAQSHAECIANFKRYLSAMPDVLDALEEAVAQHVAVGRPVALTCFERHHEDCHRSVLAAAWAARGFGREVEHVATDGCARRIRA